MTSLVGLVLVRLLRRVNLSTSQVRSVGALPFGFLRLVGFARAKFLPAGLHGSEGSHPSQRLSIFALHSLHRLLDPSLLGPSLVFEIFPNLLLAGIEI